MINETFFCFDLDGTVTKCEMLPLIANEVGLYEEIRILTDATIQGLIPLTGSFNLRLKLLSGIPLSTIQKVVNGVPLNKEIVKFINCNPRNCAIVTANMDLWISGLKEIINCKFYSSKIEYEQDKIIGSQVIDKAEIVKDLKSKYKKIICIGDGMGDVGMFEQADIAIAFGAVHFPVHSLFEFSNFYVKSEDRLCQLLKML